jgi:NhaP-type Na+/H+ or K+/H+ antiporter
LKSLGANVDMTYMIVGESLLNDGTALILYTLFYELLSINSNGHLDPGETAIYFIKVLIISPLLGVVMGMVSLLIIGLANMKNREEDTTIQLAITFICAYLSFYVAQRVLDVSGIIACVISGFILCRYAIPRYLKPETIEAVWTAVEWIGNTLLFFLSGLIVGQSFIVVTASDVGYILVIFLFLLVIRCFTIILFFPFLQLGGHGCSNWREAAFVGWAGLRGASSLALAVAFNQSTLRGLTSVTDRDAQRLVFLVGGIVALSLVIEGTFSKYLLKGLNLLESEDNSLSASEAEEKKETENRRRGGGLRRRLSFQRKKRQNEGTLLLEYLKKRIRLKAYSLIETTQRDDEEMCSRYLDINFLFSHCSLLKSSEEAPHFFEIADDDDGMRREGERGEKEGEDDSHKRENEFDIESRRNRSSKSMIPSGLLTREEQVTSPFGKRLTQKESGKQQQQQQQQQQSSRQQQMEKVGTGVILSDGGSGGGGGDDVRSDIEEVGSDYPDYFNEEMDIAPSRYSAPPPDTAGRSTLALRPLSVLHPKEMLSKELSSKDPTPRIEAGNNSSSVVKPSTVTAPLTGGRGERGERGERSGGGRDSLSYQDIAFQKLYDIRKQADGGVEASSPFSPTPPQSRSRSNTVFPPMTGGRSRSGTQFRQYLLTSDSPSGGGGGAAGGEGGEISGKEEISGRSRSSTRFVTSSLRHQSSDFSGKPIPAPKQRGISKFNSADYYPNMRYSSNISGNSPLSSSNINNGPTISAGSEINNYQTASYSLANNIMMHSTKQKKHLSQTPPRTAAHGDPSSYQLLKMSLHHPSPPASASATSDMRSDVKERNESGSSLQQQQQQQLRFSQELVSIRPQSSESLTSLKPSHSSLHSKRVPFVEDGNNNTSRNNNNPKEASAEEEKEGEREGMGETAAAPTTGEGEAGEEKEERTFLPRKLTYRLLHNIVYNDLLLTARKVFLEVMKMKYIKQINNERLPRKSYAAILLLNSVDSCIHRLKKPEDKLNDLFLLIEGHYYLRKLYQKRQEINRQSTGSGTGSGPSGPGTGKKGEKGEGDGLVSREKSNPLLLRTDSSLNNQNIRLQNMNQNIHEQNDNQQQANTTTIFHFEDNIHLRTATMILISYIESHEFAQSRIMFYLGETDNGIDTPEEDIIISESIALVTLAREMLFLISESLIKYQFTKRIILSILALQSNMIYEFQKEGIINTKNGEILFLEIEKDMKILNTLEIKRFFSPFSEYHTVPYHPNNSIPISSFPSNLFLLLGNYTSCLWKYILEYYFEEIMNWIHCYTRPSSGKAFLSPSSSSVSTFLSPSQSGNR